MSILDDANLYKRVDSTDIGSRIDGLPAQCAEAWEAGLEIRVPRTYSSVEQVIIAGMGGSAIGGDLVADLAALEDAPPITTVRDFHLPRWADQKTLVILSSHSGNTEETLSMLEDGEKAGCRMVAVTSGGKLGETANRLQLPTVHAAAPGEPRCALGYSFMTPLAILSRMGLLSQPVGWYAGAIQSMELHGANLGRHVPTEKNRAKRLAASLQGQMVVVWTSGILRGTGRRWKTQINENAKTWAIVEELPEAQHNAVVGLGMPKAAHALAEVVLLRPGNLPEYMSRRYDLTAQLLQNEDLSSHVITPEGNPLEQILNTVHLGDYTSYYLALLNGVDPHPVPAIDFLKAKSTSAI